MLLTWYIIPNPSLIQGKESLRTKLARVDFLGAFVLVSAISIFLLPLELAAELSWTHPFIIGSLSVSIVLGFLFILVEERWAREPILTPRLLAASDVLIPNTISFCQAAAQLGVRIFQPIPGRFSWSWLNAELVR
jgi:hypothetical protein